MYIDENPESEPLNEEPAPSKKGKERKKQRSQRKQVIHSVPLTHSKLEAGTSYIRPRNLATDLPMDLSDIEDEKLDWGEDDSASDNDEGMGDPADAVCYDHFEPTRQPREHCLFFQSCSNINSLLFLFLGLFFECVPRFSSPATICQWLRRFHLFSSQFWPHRLHLWCQLLNCFCFSATCLAEAVSDMGSFNPIPVPIPPSSSPSSRDGNHSQPLPKTPTTSKNLLIHVQLHQLLPEIHLFLTTSSQFCPFDMGSNIQNNSKEHATDNK